MSRQVTNMLRCFQVPLHEIFFFRVYSPVAKPKGPSPILVDVLDLRFLTRLLVLGEGLQHRTLLLTRRRKPTLYKKVRGSIDSVNIQGGNLK